MKLWEVYSKGKKEISRFLGYDDYFEAASIFRLCFGVSKLDLIGSRSEEAPKEAARKFFNLISQRVSNKPLQYILGEWEFMGDTFIVDEGVLIPREDTEVAVRVCCEVLSEEKSPTILELCSGSGIISIILGKKFENASITSIDISEEAISCMKKNLLLHKMKNIKVLKQNMLIEPFYLDKKYDLIVSNPPYIPSYQINSLQKEVLREPKIALDGGSDGLMFYRSIAKNWLKLIKETGHLVVEVGIDEAKKVKEIFCNCGLKSSIYKDLSGIDRVVSARFAC
ncbi:MAG: peptide chain release factor N(5)-glutamine methyltransferase [Oscillospiraceae bacterium]|nr:peptide chain release factor N(5)-glutamine methyltransferase [Oscillospiraceae bacterium]